MGADGAVRRASRCAPSSTGPSAQPEAGAPFDFAVTDRLVELAARRDIKLLPVVHRHARVGGAAPGEPGSPPEHIVRLHGLPARAGAALRAGRARSGTSTPSAQAAAARLADLERAAPRLLLEHQGPRARRLGAGVRAPAARQRSPRSRTSTPAPRSCSPRWPTSPGGTSPASIATASAATSTWPRSTCSPRGPANVMRGLCAGPRGSLRRGGERRKPVWLTEITWPAGQGPRPAAAGGLAAGLVHDRRRAWPGACRASTRWPRASAAASGSGGSSGTRGPRPTATATCSTTPA